MSGSTSSVPQLLQGSYFFDNIPAVAAAMDLQNAVATAASLLAQISAASLASSPTSNVGLAPGTIWNNGGVLSVA